MTAQAPWTKRKFEHINAASIFTYTLEIVARAVGKSPECLRMQYNCAY
jgi:hypothetical protein